jgi:hypothetical protein
MFTQLTEVQKRNSDSFLPYPLLRYTKTHYYNAYRTSIPHVQIIEAENIYRPAILIPCPDRSDNFGRAFVGPHRRSRIENENTLSTESIRFWGIPYKVVDRAGYDMASPAVPENPLFIQHDEINAIYNEERINNRDGDDDEDDDDI